MNSTTSVPVADIVAALKVRYPAAVCALDWGGQHDSDPETRRRNGWRLLVMARLSAQCTDARVNQVCRELFRLYPTPGALAAAPQADVEAVIRPCGLFRTKAESIRATCAILAADWAGLVPEDMDTLLSLPGVGRKIANLVRGDLYGQTLRLEYHRKLRGEIQFDSLEALKAQISQDIESTRNYFQAQ